jgi:hypothetical protein
VTLTTLNPKADKCTNTSSMFDATINTVLPLLTQSITIWLIKLRLQPGYCHTKCTFDLDSTDMFLRATLDIALPMRSNTFRLRSLVNFIRVGSVARNIGQLILTGWHSLMQQMYFLSGYETSYMRPNSPGAIWNISPNSLVLIFRDIF